MTALVVVLAALAFVGLGSYVIVGMELDRVSRDLRTVRRQRDLADAERAALQARLDSERGPVRGGVVVRLPRQRNGEGA